MRFNQTLLPLLACAAFAGTAFAGEKFEVDASHSNIGFTVRHMVVAKVSGSFRKFSGTIVYDEQDVAKSSVTVAIKTASIDTDNERRDNHLRSGDFFNAATDSLITFVSNKIEKRGEGYVAVGDFTLRGVTKQIELPFTILGKIKDPWGNTRLGVEASISINRFDYGVKWDNKIADGSLIVSDKVDIALTIEAIAAAPKPPAPKQ
jgi:polyisoprenoid-binding protein YceI